MINKEIKLSYLKKILYEYGIEYTAHAINNNSYDKNNRINKIKELIRNEHMNTEGKQSCQKNMGHQQENTSTNGNNVNQF